MSNFDDAFEKLIDIEKGYTVDSGGSTMWGVTEKVARENGYEGLMQEMPLYIAKSIAKKCYWDPYQCDQFDPKIGFQLFDAAYNGGYPIKWLQQACGVTADGVLGVKTISAVRMSDLSKTIMRFNAYRIMYYTSLTNIWPKAGKGWSNRIAKNLLYAAE